MAGTIQGGIKAKEKNIAKDPDYYKKMGSMGGRAIHHFPRGFAANNELAMVAGAKGGRISRKTKKLD